MFNFLKKKDQQEKTLRAAFWVLLVFATTALIASFTLSVEEIILIKNPDAVLSCTLNSVLNCSTVMQTWQAGLVFGIPNMFFGLMAFPVIITVAVAALWGGATYRRGFLLAMNVGMLACWVFALWLFFSSVYVIEVLCPWCLVVTFSSTMLFATSTFISLRENAFGLKKAADKKVQSFLNSGYYQMVVASFVVLLVALVFIKFGAELFA